MLKRISEGHLSVVSVCLVAGLLSCSVAGYAHTYNLHFHRDIFPGGHIDHRSFTITATKDRYCIHSVSPSSAVFPDHGKNDLKIKINYNKRFFKKCGWEHSHQFFEVTLDKDPTCKAGFEWYKPVGDTAYIRYIQGTCGLIRLHKHEYHDLLFGRNYVVIDYKDIYVGSPHASHYY